MNIRSHVNLSNKSKKSFPLIVVHRLRAESFFHIYDSMLNWFVNRLERAADVFALWITEVYILLSGADVIVAEQFLYKSDASAVFDEVCRKTMAQRMECCRFVDTRFDERT